MIIEKLGRRNDVSMNHFSKMRYKKKNVTKSWLISNGFRYNRLLSDEEVEIYTYRFPVLRYDKFTVLECELRAELNSCEIKINVYDYNTNSKYAPFYYCEYGTYNKLLEEIHNKINKKLKDLQIERAK